MGVLGVLFSGTGLLLAGEALRAHRQLACVSLPGICGDELSRYPSLTVIRPIRGLDAGAEANLRAALDHGYPGEVELLFVLDDEREPILPVLRAMLARTQAEARVLFSGHPPAGRTGKLNAMIVGLAQSRGELVAFADSDIRPDRNALSALVRTLLSAPDFGAAFAPIVATEAPRTVGDAGYALMLNGLYTPAFHLVAERNRGVMPFLMGQLMVFRREAITAIGGLESAQGQLVDDMYLGECLVRAGYRNVVCSQVVPVIQRNLALSEFVSIYARWLTFSRSGLPMGAFKLISWRRGIVFWGGLAVCVFAMLRGSWLLALPAACAPLLTAASINRLHTRQTGASLPLRFSWVSFALLLAAPLVMLRVLFWRKVRWRGRCYALDPAARLARADTGDSSSQAETSPKTNNAAP